MLISGVYYAIRTSAILTSLNVGLCGTDRRFIFEIATVEPVLTHTFRWTAQAMGYHRLWDMSGVLKINHIKTNIFWAGSHLCSPLHD